MNRQDYFFNSIGPGDGEGALLAAYQLDYITAVFLLLFFQLYTPSGLMDTLSRRLGPSI
jgi:hypothetical protein